MLKIFFYWSADLGKFIATKTMTDDAARQCNNELIMAQTMRCSYLDRWHCEGDLELSSFANMLLEKYKNAITAAQIYI